ncbi:MAG: Maf family protein [Rhizobiales bacterium]|nr:Maf family protein [Hyphomicrobiales bacterium]
MTPPLVLASQSATRVAILRNAGLAFAALPSSVDERAVEAGLLARGATPGDVALALAEAKAAEVATRRPEAIVIGADQTLDAGGERWHKPASRAEAKAHLLALAGRSHHLRSAVVGIRDGAVRYRNLGTATLTMRAFDAAEVDAYLDRVGDAALGSVGAYQIEGPGIRLFERIDGDYFTILGLPLLPLLAWLRDAGALDP